MDIFAHGLWTGAVARAANKKWRISLSTWPAVFWGVFPDLFAFTLLFSAAAFGSLFGSISVWENITLADLPGPHALEPLSGNHLFLFFLTTKLYSISHSAVIFAAVFFCVWAIRKKPYWEMTGWLLHILIDIPTHSYKFFPTPFLWPVSQVKINGISWADPRFLLLNYAAIALVYFLLRSKKRKTVGGNRS
jgi:hypothetical protein